jgi:hypothetical protein
MSPKEGSSTRHPNRGPLVGVYICSAVCLWPRTSDHYRKCKAIRFKGSSCCKHYTTYDFDKWNGMGQFNCLAMVA